MPDRAGIPSQEGRGTPGAGYRLLNRKLGPMPAASLRAMRDYGLGDEEIARYYGMTPASVARCRRLLSIDATELRGGAPAIRPPGGPGGGLDRG